MPPIRLIAMDMDGTLLNRAQSITEGNLRALRCAVKAGVRLAVCSGRTAEDISYFLSDANLCDCAVLGLNGACCLDTPHAAPYAVHTLKKGAAQKVTDILLFHKVTFAAFQQKRVIVVQGDAEISRAIWGTYIDRGNPEGYAYGEEALLRYAKEGICKFVYIDQPAAQRLAQIHEKLLQIDDLQITSSWNDNLELIPLGVGKGVALLELADRLHIPREQTMAIGDFDNDLDMVHTAGLGVAMGNASPALLRAAAFVTTDNEHDGVAQAVLRFALHA
jgi:Cof subfamily protein (haloacid dehalogenase superfamily)